MGQIQRIILFLTPNRVLALLAYPVRTDPVATKDGRERPEKRPCWLRRINAPSVVLKLQGGKTEVDPGEATR